MALELPESVAEGILNAHLNTMRPLVRARPDAAAALRALRARGIRTALLSSTHWPPSWHEELLALDGMLGLLDERVYGTQLQRLKPDPAAFRAVLDRLGLQPDQVVHIGDQAAADVEGAKRAGMRTIWFQTGPETAPGLSADAAVTSLIEVVGVLDDWATGVTVVPR
jgi:putative hydrolase of the HAD superfamily